MSNTPPIVNLDITCRKCGLEQTRTIRAWVGDRFSLNCNGCRTKMTITLEP